MNNGQENYDEIRPNAPALRLSALVVAHNEEARIAACLERLEFADEIVVVLDRCTDQNKRNCREDGRENP